jgi:transposase InsO family protein
MVMFINRIPNQESRTVAGELEMAIAAATLLPDAIMGDNGGEFVGKAFQLVLENHGIIWLHSHPYTPQENGKVERFWETLETLPAKEGMSLEEVVTKYHGLAHWGVEELPKHRGLPVELGNSPNRAWSRSDLQSPGHGVSAELFEIWNATESRWHMARTEAEEDRRLQALMSAEGKLS